MADYLPESDTKALEWARHLVNYSAGHTAETQFSAADISAMTDALNEFDAAFGEHTSQQSAARAARRKKDEARRRLESVLRPRVRKVQADPAVKSEVLRAMGLRPRDTVRTPVGVPASAPSGIIDTSQRLKHTIRFWDTESGRRAKPKGIHGCEVWVKIGDADSAPQYAGTASRSPFIKEFKADSAGKLAHYQLRWQNTRGIPGPWSETLTATIPA